MGKQKSKTFIKKLRNKKLIILGTVIVSFVILSGTMNNIIPLHNRALVVGMGIDYKDDIYEVTVEAYVAQMNMGPTMEQVLTVSATGETIERAVEVLQVKTGKVLSFALCSVVIVGSGLAEKGVINALDFFVSQVDTASNAVMLYTQETAREMMWLNLPIHPSAMMILRETLDARKGTAFEATTVKDFYADFFSLSKTATMPILEKSEIEIPEWAGGGGPPIPMNASANANANAFANAECRMQNAKLWNGILTNNEQRITNNEQRITNNGGKKNETSNDSDKNIFRNLSVVNCQLSVCGSQLSVSGSQLSVVNCQLSVGDSLISCAVDEGGGEEKEVQEFYQIKQTAVFSGDQYLISLDKDQTVALNFLLRNRVKGSFVSEHEDGKVEVFEVKRKRARFRYDLDKKIVTARVNTALHLTETLPADDSPVVQNQNLRPNFTDKQIEKIQQKITKDVLGVVKYCHENGADILRLKDRFFQRHGRRGLKSLEQIEDYLDMIHVEVNVRARVD